MRRIRAKDKPEKKLRGPFQLICSKCKTIIKSSPGPGKPQRTYTLCKACKNKGYW